MSTIIKPRCRAQYEPVPHKDRDRTHTCCRDLGHDGPHVCPTCQRQWDTPGKPLGAATGAERRTDSFL